MKDTYTTPNTGGIFKGYERMTMVEEYSPDKKLNESEIYDIPGLDAIDRSVVGYVISAFNKETGSREQDLMSAIQLLKKKTTVKTDEDSDIKKRDDILWDLIDSNYYITLARLNEALMLERYRNSEKYD